MMSDRKGIPFPEAGESEEHIAIRCARAGIDMHKVGRNHSCPCGSGKKFKKCCIDETPIKLCERFARAEHLFSAADRLGNFEYGNKQAEIFNETLEVLMKLDPNTFRKFKPLPIRDADEVFPTPVDQ